MNNLLNVFLSVLFFTSVSAKPNEWATRYKLLLFGANIGEFSVTQTDNNGNVNIEATTDVKVKFLFSYRIKYVQKTVYDQGILQSSHIETYKNGKLNSNTWLKYEDVILQYAEMRHALGTIELNRITTDETND